MENWTRYDCIIAGAGPGGLQAAIHLARYNRPVLLVDRGASAWTLAGNYCRRPRRGGGNRYQQPASGPVDLPLSGSRWRSTL